jgi:hypothetical protein
MGDSILNFGDLTDTDSGTDTSIYDTGYTGLNDTASGFSGSSTLQDVQLGSPVLLDSSYGANGSAAVTDLSAMGGVQVTGVPQPSGDLIVASQSLSGVSNPPFGSAAQSPAPNVTPPSATSSAGITALGKFGASLATLFAGPSQTTAAAKPVTSTISGASLVSGAASGTNTLILLIVVGALIALLARGE